MVRSMCSKTEASNGGTSDDRWYTARFCSGARVDRMPLARSDDAADHLSHPPPVKAPPSSSASSTKIETIGGFDTLSSSETDVN